MKYKKSDKNESNDEDKQIRKGVKIELQYIQMY